MCTFEIKNVRIVYKQNKKTLLLINIPFIIIITI